jgi:hypothetical protein
MGEVEAKQTGSCARMSAGSRVKAGTRGQNELAGRDK